MAEPYAQSMKHRVLCVALVILTMTGCTPAPAPAPAPTPAPTRETPTTTATPSAAAPTPASAAPLTCDTLLVPEAIAALKHDGYALVPGYGMEPTHYLHPFIEYGGVACMWGPDYATDAVTVFAKSPITAEQAATEKGKLVAEGWLVSRDSTGETWTSPEGADLYISAIRFTERTWAYALSEAELAYIAD